MLTYPRTDSRALPEDYLRHGQGHAGDARRERHTHFAPFAQAGRSTAELGQAEQAHLRQRQDLGPLRDHPDAAGAEEPVARPSRSSTTWSCKRFLAVFFPPAEFLVTTRIYAQSAGAASSRPKARCWSSPAGSRSTASEARRGGRRRTLVPVAPGRDGRAPRTSTSTALKTKPPARYTEATLLSAMEGAGKLIEDDELREAMAGEGPRHAGDARGDHSWDHAGASPSRGCGTDPRLRPKPGSVVNRSAAPAAHAPRRRNSMR